MVLLLRLVTHYDVMVIFCMFFMAAYFTQCDLQPVDLKLTLRTALTLLFKVGH